MKKEFPDVINKLIFFIRLPMYLVPINLIAAYYLKFSKDPLLNNIPVGFWIALLTFLSIANALYLFWLSNKIRKGRNWARIFYVLLTIIGISVSLPNIITVFTNSVFMGLLSVITYLLTFYSLHLILVNAQVKEYFKIARIS